MDLQRVKYGRVGGAGGVYALRGKTGDGED